MSHLDGVSIDPGLTYDEATRTVAVASIQVGINQTLQIDIEDMAALDPETEKRAAVLRILRRARIKNYTKLQINDQLDQVLHDPTWLNHPNLKLTPSHILALRETIENR